MIQAAQCDDTLWLTMNMMSIYSVLEYLVGG